MTKEELVHITIKQLSESLATTPENFKFEDPAQPTNNGAFPGPTVIWQFKVKLDEDRFISDPLNSTKTIIVTYNKMARQLSCLIFNKEVNSLNFNTTPDTTAVVQFNHNIPLFFNRTYRQFNNLKQSLLKRRNQKEYMDYMKKLQSIFPSTGDDDLFKI